MLRALPVLSHHLAKQKQWSKLQLARLQELHRQEQVRNKALAEAVARSKGKDSVQARGFRKLNYISHQLEFLQTPPLVAKCRLTREGGIFAKNPHPKMFRACGGLK